MAEPKAPRPGRARRAKSGDREPAGNTGRPASTLQVEGEPTPGTEERKIDRRSRPYRQLRALATAEDTNANNGSEDVEVIDGIAFDYRRESRCSVCAAGGADAGLPNGPQVQAIVDAMLVRSATYKDVLERIDPLMGGWPARRRIGYHSIRRHGLRHLPADQVALRAIVERRALERGLRVAVGSGPLVTTASLLEIVRLKGFEAIADGTVVPSAREAVEASRVLDELDRQGGQGVAAAELARQVTTLVEVVRRKLGPDAWSGVVEEVTRRLEADSEVELGGPVVVQLERGEVDDA